MLTTGWCHMTPKAYDIARWPSQQHQYLHVLMLQLSAQAGHLKLASIEQQVLECLHILWSQLSIERKATVEQSGQFWAADKRPVNSWRMTALDPLLKYPCRCQVAPWLVTYAIRMHIHTELSLFSLKSWIKLTPVFSGTETIMVALVALLQLDH